MKKIVGLFTLSIALTAMSCSDKPKPVETTKEVVVVPAAAPATVEKPAPPATPPTKITLNRDGAKVATKKVDVTINKP